MTTPDPARLVTVVQHMNDLQVAVDEHWCPWPQRRLRDLRIAPDNVGGHDIVGDEQPTLRVELWRTLDCAVTAASGLPAETATARDRHHSRAVGLLNKQGAGLSVVILLGKPGCLVHVERETVVHCQAPPEWAERRHHLDHGRVRTVDPGEFAVGIDIKENGARSNPQTRSPERNPAIRRQQFGTI